MQVDERLERLLRQRIVMTEDGRPYFWSAPAVEVVAALIRRNASIEAKWLDKDSGFLVGEPAERGDFVADPPPGNHIEAHRIVKVEVDSGFDGFAPGLRRVEGATACGANLWETVSGLCQANAIEVRTNRTGRGFGPNETLAVDAIVTRREPAGG